MRFRRHTSIHTVQPKVDSLFSYDSYQQCSSVFTDDWLNLELQTCLVEGLESVFGGEIVAETYKFMPTQRGKLTPQSPQRFRPVEHGAEKRPVSEFVGLCSGL